MRASEFLKENFGPERYPGILPIGDYLGPDEHEFAPPGNYKDSGYLHEEVWDLMDAGIEPRVVSMNPKMLLATQDWLSNDGGDDPLFPEFPDRPVVYDKQGKYYILDGHHRTTAALKAGRPISVYLFSDEMKPQPDRNDDINENFADGKIKGKSRPGRVKRSGASCAGSVTDLRAKAKKYGGERGRMYHWCANMKSGKK